RRAREIEWFLSLERSHSEKKEQTPGAHPPTKQRARRFSQLVLLHHQHNDQLSVANLWPANDQRARLVQLRIGFQQQLLLLKKFQVQNVRARFLAPRIDVQGEVFACCQPILLARLQRLARFANQLHPRIAKKLPQRSFYLRHFRRRRLGGERIARDEQAAPDRLLLARVCQAAYREDENRDERSQPRGHIIWLRILTAMIANRPPTARLHVRPSSRIW